MEQRETTISLWARRVMEACWLVALVLIPVYFSLLSDRHFEPDKAVMLRSLVTLLGAAWIIYILERGQAFRAWPRWREWFRGPLIVPTLVYAGVFILTTLTSVLIFTSIFGGYNRLQGLYTNLAYIVIFGAIVAHVRRREQLDRIITTMIAAMLPVLGYAWIQHNAVDPLPWAGDTAARVASTMGNSIFVAAYIILVLPFVLYRLAQSITSLRQAIASDTGAEGDGSLYVPHSDPVDDPSSAPFPDLAWLAAFAALAFGQIALLWGILKLGALLQSPLADLNHWWMFPAAVVVVGSSYPLLSYRTTTRPRNDWRLYLPGFLVLGFVLLVLLSGYISAESCAQNSNVACLNTDMATASRAADYGSWIMLGVGGYFLFYLAVLLLPRRISLQPSPLLRRIMAVVYALLTVFTVLIVFFTQSRGPQMGMFVSLFAFVTLLLVQAWRTFRTRRKLFTSLLAGWMLLVALGAGFLVVLNTTNSFAGLRQNRYIARLGNLLETEGGTGQVRVLIWRGDEWTRGAVGLVTSDPLRTIIGWGPETMFVAYNPFYPPSLALLESRGASPDRSHQALLDELVTKGALGLFSHLFLYGSFAILMLRLLRVPRVINVALTTLFMLGIAAFFTIFLESTTLGIIALVAGLLAVALAIWLGYARPLAAPLPFGWQVLVIACLSAVLANFVENVFGIPIVSTLLYTWAVMGLGVVGGMFAGAYALGTAPQPIVEPEPEPETTTPASRKKQQQRRTKTSGRRVGSRRTSSGASAPWRVLYPLVAVLALLAIWFLNVDNIYADMRFMQSKQWTNQQGPIPHTLGYAALQDAIAKAPTEDLYYLMYGRSLMVLAQDINATQSQQLQTNPQIANIMNRQPQPGASIDDLPRADYNVQSAQQTFQTLASRYSALQMLDYARLALERAQQLNPQNKDHPANLGRLEASWYVTILNSNPAEAQQHLELAIRNYRRAHEIAPQDVELTGQMAMAYTHLEPDGLAQATELLAEATRLDPGYGPNRARLGEVKRKQGDLAGAAQEYALALAYDPRGLNASLDPVPGANPFPAILAAMQSDPQLLDTFLSGYAKAIERRPNDLNFRQTYTQVLSDTGRYQQAAEQARAAISVADELNQPKVRDTFQQFLNYFEQRLTGSK